MWSASTLDVENVNFVLDQQIVKESGPEFHPNPYVFTKLENGRKIAVKTTSITPPSWLLLDHSIAVIWSLFNAGSAINQLSIDDLKWAYEFLKGVKNKKGENPPDVKVCLNKIQDRLIYLYANLSPLKDEDFDDIASSFDDNIMEDSASYFDTEFVTNEDDSKLDTLSMSSSQNPLCLVEKQSANDLTKMEHTRALANSGEKSYSHSNDSKMHEYSKSGNNDDVEKYVLSLFDSVKKDGSLQVKQSAKSLIPTKKKMSPSTLPEVESSLDVIGDGAKKTKISKRVRCVAEMRSLKFHKSMKVKDDNGEEAAYSNLKAEIQRLTINPKVSKNDVMKFLKDWRSEQVEKLHNELKRLSSIEEFMKTLAGGEVNPRNSVNFPEPENRRPTLPPKSKMKF